MSSEPVQRFQDVFNRLNADNLILLDQIYAEEVVFEDPLHRVEGLPALREYFAKMYAGVAEISFDWETTLESDGMAMLTWTMHMRHQRLKPRETLALPGASLLQFGEQIHYHRDYFDLGALIYERLPVLGSLVRAVRARA